ncbi:MAG: zinc ribbon domain-containing protein [Clostridiales bacterium]|nr:zinc ribbon domain-containing protein [Clostridiales bacterium]
MKCEYCGKPVKEGDQYCQNCGAKIKGASAASNTAATAAAETGAPKTEKKKMSAGKIILIVFLCATLLVGVAVGGIIALFRAVAKSVDFDEVISQIEDYDFDDFDNIDDFDFSDDEYDDSIDKWFSQHFDADENDDIDDSPFDRSGKGRSDAYKGTENFVPGKTDKKTGAYGSEYANLAFQLPASWHVFTDTEIAKLYYDEGVDKSTANNKLYVYDFYAEDSLTGNTVYIKFYNKDYFSEYKDLAAVNDAIRESAMEFSNRYKVDYAEDSSITLNGEKYNQLACRISGEDVLAYQYDFTRDLGDYFMHIEIFAYDLDDVGEIIDTLNAKG